MRVTFNSWRQRFLLFLFFSCIAAILLAPIGSNIFIPDQLDVLNHLAAIIQAKLALLEGQFPLRVMPLANNGFRYPFYQFYSPTSYMVAGIFSFVHANPFIVYKLIIWSAFVAGGIFMYRLAYWFVKSNIAALLACVVYLLSPYNFILVNHIGAFNEAIAIGIFPIVLYYTLQNFYYPHLKAILKTSFAWYCLATIHLPAFFYSMLFVILWLLMISYKNFYWKNFLLNIIAICFGCMMALWYLAPIALLGKYLIINRTFDSVSYFHSSSPAFSYLLSPAVNIINKFSSLNQAHNIIEMIHPSIGLPIVFAVGIAIYAVLNKNIAINERADSLITSLLILFLIAFFLIWSPFNIWQWLPHPFLMIQYTWRILGQVIWIGALLFAWAACWLFQNKLDARHFVLGVLLLAALAGLGAATDELNYFFSSSFLKNSQLGLNPHSYFIDARMHKKFVGAVDSVMLDALMQPADKVDMMYNLKLNDSVMLSPSFLKSAENPYLFLTGIIPSDYERNVQVAAVINNKIVSLKEIVPGQFTWNIPLKNFIKNKKAIKLFLSFKVVVAQSNDLAVPVEAVVLGGNFNIPKLMSVDKVASHCMQSGESLLCALSVPKQTYLIELPAIYYPGMLSIKVNGKPVQYLGVMNQSQLLAGIAPVPGKINSIEIKFNGLLWANYLSSAMWQLWLLLVVYLFLRKIFYSSINID